jgi:hypothetical protein
MKDETEVKRHNGRYKCVRFKVCKVREEPESSETKSSLGNRAGEERKGHLHKACKEVRFHDVHERSAAFLYDRMYASANGRFFAKLDWKRGCGNVAAMKFALELLP